MLVPNGVRFREVPLYHLPEISNERIQIFHNDCMSCRENKREGERERRPLELNALAAHVATYFLNYVTWYESDDRK